MALFAIVRRRVGDGPLAIAVGMVAAAAIWTGVSWTFAIGDEAVAAAFVTAIGIGEFGKRLSVSRGQR